MSNKVLVVKARNFNEYFDIKDQWVSLDKPNMDSRPELYGEVASVMNTAYAPVGGHAKYRNEGDLEREEKHSRYDMVDNDKDPYVDAAKVYSETDHGFKASLSGHDDGEGKDAAKEYNEWAYKQPGHYTEASGPMANFLNRVEAPIVTDTQDIQSILGEKPHEIRDSDRGVYSRNIGGKEYEKQIFGNPLINQGEQVTDEHMRSVRENLSEDPTKPFTLDIQTGESMEIAFQLLKAQQTIPSYITEDIENIFDPETRNIILSSKPNTVNEKNPMSEAEQSERHDRLLFQIGELENKERMKIITGRGNSEKWGNENSIALSNVPDHLVDEILALAGEHEQDSVLHSPSGTGDTQFLKPSGEIEGTLEEGGFTEDSPSDHTAFPTGQKYSYGGYTSYPDTSGLVEMGEPMDIAFQLLKERVSPEAKRHKLEYDTKYESSPERVKYREGLNRERRRRGIYGAGDGKDVSHTEGGKLTLEGEHSNRARHFKDKGTLRHTN